MYDQQLQSIIKQTAKVSSILTLDKTLADNFLLHIYIYHEHELGNQLTRLQLEDLANLVADGVSPEGREICRQRLRESIKDSQEFIDFRDQVKKQVKLIVQPDNKPTEES